METNGTLKRKQTPHTRCSGIYCFADIWANCELLLVITAANLALSRSIYVYFFSSESAGSDHSDRFEPRQPSSSKSHSSSGYHLQAKLRCERVERPMTTIEGGRRLPQPPLPSLIVRGSLRRHNHNRSVDYENDDNDDTIPHITGDTEEDRVLAYRRPDEGRHLVIAATVVVSGRRGEHGLIGALLVRT